MIEMDMVYFGKRSGLNGVNSVIDTLLINQDGFGDDIHFRSVISSENIEREATVKSSSVVKKASGAGGVKGQNSLTFFLILIMRYFRNALKTVLRIQTADVLVFHDIWSSFFFYILKSRTNQCRKILVIHSNGNTFSMFNEKYPSSQKKIFRKILSMIEKTAVKTSDAVVFVSKTSMNTFNSMHRAYIDKTSFIYNGLPEIDINDIVRHNSERVRICIVGSVSKRKGHDLIFNALKLLDVEILNQIELNIVGDGNYLSVLQKDLESLSCVKVVFHGWSQNVNQILYENDVFLLPSKDEGLPISIIEAMRSGLPIAATAVGGIPELVSSGVNGYLFEPDENGLSQAFRWIIENQPHLKEMGIRSYKSYKTDFIDKKMISQYAKLVRRVFHGN